VDHEIQAAERFVGFVNAMDKVQRIDEVVSLAYTERRRPSKEQPLAL